MRRKEKIILKPAKRNKYPLSKNNEEEIFSDYIALDNLCGTWESEGLCPTLLIYKDHSVYKLSVIHIGQSGQAQPATYKIYCNNSVYFIFIGKDKTELVYNALRDELSLIDYGIYLRKNKD